MRKLAELETYIKQIREYSSITVKEYSKDWKLQRIVERTFQNDKIDETIIVNILRQNLKDFLEYRDFILKIIK